MENKNQLEFGKEVANILLNIPSEQREWITANVPPDLFGTWCMFLSSKTVKERIVFYREQPDKIFWNK
jgi:hypothetical protein